MWLIHRNTLVPQCNPIAHLQVGRQTGRQAGRQAGRRAGRRAGRQASRLAWLLHIEANSSDKLHVQEQVLSGNNIAEEP